MMKCDHCDSAAWYLRDDLGKVLCGWHFKLSLETGTVAYDRFRFRDLDGFKNSMRPSDFDWSGLQYDRLAYDN